MTAESTRRTAEMRGGRATALLLAALLAGCGGSDDRSPAAALRIPPAGGVAEIDLLDADVAVHLDHTPVMSLEAVHSGEDDTHESEGVDAVPYYFRRPTRLTLVADDGGGRPVTMTLRDAGGAALAETGPDGAAAEVRVPPGRYVLEIRHPQAGDAAAEAFTLFVEARRAAATTAAGGPAADDSATLRAGKDCRGCNLRGVTLYPPTTIGAVDLTFADFTGAKLYGVVCNGTTLSGAVFDDASLQFTLLNNVIATRASFRRATFTGGARIQEVGALPRAGAHDQADFSGARFQSACLNSPDLRGARFAGAHFDAATIVGGANFAGADLSEAVFAGTDLKRVSDACGTLPEAPARLAGAITGSDRSGVQLLGVDLGGLDLSGLDLRRATLRGSRFDATTRTVDTDFSGTSFAAVDVSRADLSAARLSLDTSFAGAVLSDGVAHGVDLSRQVFADQTTQFRGAVLAHSRFEQAGLEAADLSGADLTGASLVGANLNFANLRGARLVGAHLGIAPGSGRAATRMRGAYMVDVDLTDADLRSADLTDAHLYGDTTTAVLVRTKLDSAVLDGALCAGAVFSGSLTDAVLDGAVLVDAVFNGANLTNAKLDNAYLQGTDFRSATSVAGVQLSNAAVSTAPGTWMYTEADGTPFTYQYGATQLGPLASDTSVTCPNGEFGPCTGARLTPVMDGPFPPVPPCIPRPPRYDNCLPPDGGS